MYLYMYNENISSLYYSWSFTLSLSLTLLSLCRDQTTMLWSHHHKVAEVRQMTNSLKMFTSSVLWLLAAFFFLSSLHLFRLLFFFNNFFFLLWFFNSLSPHVWRRNPKTDSLHLLLTNIFQAIEKKREEGKDLYLILSITTKDKMCFFKYLYCSWLKKKI